MTLIILNSGLPRCWWQKMLALGDWRRLAHSAKMGLALVLVSLSVLLQDVFDVLGPNAVWAIFTVVFIFDYTVGATVSKGLNRAVGTVLAACVALFVDYVATFTGAAIQPYVVGFSVFLIGMMATYLRFLPPIKENFDYGIVIFLLTFCLVAVSGYRVTKSIDVFVDRIVTVMVGIAISLLVNIFIFPIWAGDDLQNLVNQNIEGVATALEECLKKYFQGVGKVCGVSPKICKAQPFDDKIYKGYRGVLTSSRTEESLAIFARWEPRQGFFRCTYRWRALVELGATLRHCAYTISALHSCVLSEIQAPGMVRKVYAGACMRVGEEVARLLRGVATDMRAKCISPPKEALLFALRHALQHLHSLVRTHNPHPLYIHPVNPNPNPNPNPIPSPNSTNPTYHRSNSSPCPIPNKFSNFTATNSVQGGLLDAPKEDLKVPSLDLMEFAGMLSMASLISLLIEMVARVEHLLDANGVFQEQAGFRKRKNLHDDDNKQQKNVDHYTHTTTN